MDPNSVAYASVSTIVNRGRHMLLFCPIAYKDLTANKVAIKYLSQMCLIVLVQLDD